MSGFLVNLARRGAGMVPVAAPRPSRSAMLAEGIEAHSIATVQSDAPAAPVPPAPSAPAAMVQRKAAPAPVVPPVGQPPTAAPRQTNTVAPPAEVIREVHPAARAPETPRKRTAPDEPQPIVVPRIVPQTVEQRAEAPLGDRDSPKIEHENPVPEAPTEAVRSQEIDRPLTELPVPVEFHPPAARPLVPASPPRPAAAAAPPPNKEPKLTQASPPPQMPPPPVVEPVRPATAAALPDPPRPQPPRAANGAPPVPIAEVKTPRPPVVRQERGPRAADPRPLEIRIGTVEVRLAAPPAAVAGNPIPEGFDDYSMLRNYMFGDSY